MLPHNNNDNNNSLDSGFANLQIGSFRTSPTMIFSDTGSDTIIPRTNLTAHSSLIVNNVNYNNNTTGDVTAMIPLFDSVDLKVFNSDRVTPQTAAHIDVIRVKVDVGELSAVDQNLHTIKNNKIVHHINAVQSAGVETITAVAGAVEAKAVAALGTNEALVDELGANIHAEAVEKLVKARITARTKRRLMKSIIVENTLRRKLVGDVTYLDDFEFTQGLTGAAGVVSSAKFGKIVKRLTQTIALCDKLNGADYDTVENFSLWAKMLLDIFAIISTDFPTALERAFTTYYYARENVVTRRFKTLFAVKK